MPGARGGRYPARMHRMLAWLLAGSLLLWACSDDDADPNAPVTPMDGDEARTPSDAGTTPGPTPNGNPNGPMTPSGPVPGPPGPVAGGPGPVITGPADAGAPDADAGATLDAGPAHDAGPTTPAPVDPLTGDRDAFFGDSRCATLGALFCDGFEGPSIDGAWQKQGPGTVEIDASQQARGKSSLHVHTEGNGFAYLRLSSIFPLADNRYYGRMFVRFDALPSAPTWAHWTIAEAAGGGNNSLIRVGGQLDRQHNRFGVGSDRGPTGDWTFLDDDPTGMGATVPEDEWLCVEWLHDGSSDTTRFYWDAVEHASLATTASDHGGADVPYNLPDFSSVWIGFWLYQGGPTPDHYDLWIDEVAFDDERIGCAR